MNMHTKSTIEGVKANAHEGLSRAYEFAGDVTDVAGNESTTIKARLEKTAAAASGRTAELADQVTEAATAASKVVKRKASETAAKAREGAHATAEAVREHPGATAAILGGIATAAVAAVAGVKYYQSRTATAKKPARKSATKSPSGAPKA
jgi:ElaB/YqjD/DUF883 family membrane-anchored ribosome-binding protein